MVRDRRQETSVGVLHIVTARTRPAGHNFGADGHKVGHSPGACCDKVHDTFFFPHGEDLVIRGTREGSARLVEVLMRVFSVKDRVCLDPTLVTHRN